MVKDPGKKAKSLVRKITHTGETELDSEFLKELKAICKSSSDQVIREVYRECLKCLAKEHSQVRVTTVRLFNYLFQKSHIIREKVLDDFDIFLELTLAISKRPKIKLKLPPPKKYAAMLQEITIKYIHSWHSDYGPGYERIRYIYKYLNEHRLVDFGQLQVRTREDHIKQQKLAEHQKKILTRSIENKLKEYRDLRPEIQRLIAQIESLLDLLVPSDESFDELGFDLDGPDPENATKNLDDSTYIPITQSHHGIANLTQSVEIEFSPYVEIKKNAESQETVLTLRELKKELIEGKLTRLAAIEKTLCKRSDEFVGTIRDMIDIKSKAMNLILKLSELKIVTETEQGSSKRNNIDDADNSDPDSDSDFEEVAPKDGLETYIPKSMRHEYGLSAIDPRELSSSSEVRLVEESFGSSSGGEASCSMDSSIPAPLTCNVRLESGKLCPRRDKIKCPFHGKIIARDLDGVALSESDRIEEEKKRKKKPNVPEWQDPELLRDIKAATGVDLTMPARSKSRLSPNKKKLADTRTCDTTPMQRLQKRLRLLNK